MWLKFLLFSLLIHSTVSAGCNGNIKLCDRRYSQVTQIGAHDSPFVGPLLSDNQGLSVTQQLDAGIRMLTGQIHTWVPKWWPKIWWGGDPYMCHTSCYLLAAGTLTKYLKTIREWLDAHPNEVVTVLLVNGGDVSLIKFENAMVDSGLSRYAFNPGKTLTLDEWPTLQELINSDQRLVLFLDSGADTSYVPYILPEFVYFWETIYDTTDSSFTDCSIDRPKGASSDGRMGIINHFLDDNWNGILTPANHLDWQTNSVTSIIAQVDHCNSIHGGMANFVLVDRVGTGDVFQAQDLLNGL